jgi:hypothetical protein
MADNGSIFATETVPGGWFAPETQGHGWFDRDGLDPASAGGVTITGTLFADGDSFGSGSVNHVISGAIFADPDAFGAGTITSGINITGTLFADSDAFGAGSVSTRLTGTLFSDGDSFGSGSFSINVIGSLFSDADTFGVGSVGLGVSGTLYADPDAFGGGVVSGPGVQNIAGTLFVDGDTFGSGVVEVQQKSGGGIGGIPRKKRKYIIIEEAIEEAGKAVQIAIAEPTKETKKQAVIAVKRLAEVDPEFEAPKALVQNMRSIAPLAAVDISLYKAKQRATAQKRRQMMILLLMAA